MSKVVESEKVANTIVVRDGDARPHPIRAFVQPYTPQNAPISIKNEIQNKD